MLQKLFVFAPQIFEYSTFVETRMRKVYWLEIQEKDVQDLYHTTVSRVNHYTVLWPIIIQLIF